MAEYFESSNQAHAERTNFDAKTLELRQTRFVMHHRERYLATLAKLDGTRRDIVAALPALFHTNHPSLPGYIAGAPEGFAHFQFDAAAEGAAKRISRSFDLRAHGRNADLEGLYLMGSGGSVGHTADSDIDFWVVAPQQCHSALKPKLDLIQAWALEKGLALQGFLVDPVFFTDPQDTVHGPLLLDEFYRSGIWLAGRMPLWWLVRADDQYTANVASLFHYRFADPTRFIDFGSVGTPSQGELAAAALRELKHALQTPYKSLLKFALIETYARLCEEEEQALPLLSSYYQHLMFEGVDDVTRLDTYSLLFEYLSKHWTEAASFTRADLQHLFVHKVVSRSRQPNRNSNLMSVLGEWGYTDAQLKHLRNPNSHSLSQVLREYTRQCDLINQGFFGANALLDAYPELTPTVQQLKALHGTFTATDEDGKVERLNPNLLPAIRPALTIERTRDQWAIKEGSQVVRKAGDYVALLLWLYDNGISPSSLRMPTQWLENGRRALDSLLSRNTTTSVLVNPYPALAMEDELVVSSHSDPLSYGGLRQNHLRQLIVLERTAHRTHQRVHTGARACVEALDALSRNQRTIAIAASAADDRQLVARLNELIEQLRAVHVAGNNAAFPIGRQFAYLPHDRLPDQQCLFDRNAEVPNGTVWITHQHRP